MAEEAATAGVEVVVSGAAESVVGGVERKSASVVKGGEAPHGVRCGGVKGAHRE